VDSCTTTYLQAKGVVSVCLLAEEFKKKMWDRREDKSSSVMHLDTVPVSYLKWALWSRIQPVELFWNRSNMVNNTLQHPPAATAAHQRHHRQEPHPHNKAMEG